MKGRVVFHRLGSDPEFLFLKDGKKAPATEVLQCTKQQGLASFIGCDSHPATAELRPSPARMVNRHLLDIAGGLGAVHKWLSRFGNETTQCVALPYILQEALGGHIHVSFFFKEPDTSIAMGHNYVWHGGMQAYDSSRPLVASSDVRMVEAIQRYVYAAVKGEAITPRSVCHTLDYLISPFEHWIQEWTSRTLRFLWCKHAQHYNSEAPGNGNNHHYLVRWVLSQRPHKALFKDYRYMHVEYRTPSTWLLHPALAYAYLALAKLTMLNYDMIRPLAYATKPVQVSATEKDPNLFRNMFTERFDRVKSQLRYTSDLLSLPDAIEFCDKKRFTWELTAGRIDFDAWAAIGGSYL
jgi:hypothetical protein